MTPSTQTGVVWSPSGRTTLKPGDSVTYLATPAAGYAFPGKQARSWTFTDTLNPDDCPSPPPVSRTVTPVEPAATTPTCQQQNEVVTPGSQTGVVSSPSGSTTVKPGQSVVYTASPAGGYAFPGKQARSWTFSNSLNTGSCSTPATPANNTTPPAPNGTPSGLPVGATGDSLPPSSGSNLPLIGAGLALLMLAGGLVAPRLRRGARS